MKREYFTTSLEHILAELQRIDLFSGFYLRSAGRLNRFDEGFQKPFMREQIVDEMQLRSSGIQRRETVPASRSQNEIRNALDQMNADIWLQKSESKRRESAATQRTSVAGHR